MLDLASGGGHGGTGHVAGQSWLLRGQHVAQNLQSQLHVLREEGFDSTCVPAALHGAGEWAYTQSMFRLCAFGNWESFVVSCACAGDLTNAGLTT